MKLIAIPCNFLHQCTVVQNACGARAVKPRSKMYKISCTRCWTIVLPKYCRTFAEIKMGKLSLANRNRAIGLLQAGTAKRHVAIILNCSRVTIQKYWRRFQQGQSLDDLPGSGRPHVTTPNQDRLMHARRRFTPAMETARNTVGTHNRRSSAKTVRRRLATNQMLARRPYKGLIFTGRHRRNRLAWANNHVGWTRQQWRRCFLQMKVNSTCHFRTVISGFTGVVAKGSLSVVPWNIIDGVVEG